MPTTDVSPNVVVTTTEPILTVDSTRFTLFPLRHHDILGRVRET